MRPLRLVPAVTTVLATILGLLPLATPTATAVPDGTPPVRDTEPVVLTGAELGGWAVPGDQEVKANSFEGAQCQLEPESESESESESELPAPDTPVTSSEPCSHNTYEEPDASTQDVVRSAGIPTTELLGYRWDASTGAFVQVPFQVDERFVRHISNDESGFSFYSETDRHVTYAFDREGFRWTASDPSDPCLAAPASELATDPVPGLDTDDELAFLWRDTGPRAPSDAQLPQGIADTREVAVTDPTTGATTYLYVMQAGDDGPAPAFDETNGYVRYQRDPDADVFLLSESSNESYGDAPAGPRYDPATDTCKTDEHVQRRPKDTATITTPRYRFRYEGRWLMTDLQVSDAPDGDWTYGPDLVDQWKARAFQQRPGGETPCCGYEEEVNNWGGSSMLLGELTGPVRAIRETWGADSGTNVIRREVFYRDEIRFQSFLRVHPIPPLDGIYTQWDHNAGAVSTYYNPHVPDGVAIDGHDDETYGNGRLYLGQEGLSYEDPGLPPIEACRPGTDCSGGEFVDNDIDSPDPFFSGVNGLLDWEEVAGPNGTLVTRWWAQQHTPGGAAHAPLTVPYYRDDACFDDGTGSDPGPHVHERNPDGDDPSDSTWTDDDGNVRERECWDRTKMDDPTYPDYADDLGTRRFYQGSIGTHGLHLLAIAESDNAHTTAPMTEIDAEQRMVVLPAIQRNVGEAYGRAPEFPLHTTVTPTSFAPTDTPGGRWLAGDLHIHTTYSHDSWDPATEPHYDPTSDEPENEPYTLGNSTEEQFAVAASRGLDYLAITDHNDVRSQRHFDDTSGVLPIPGFENSLKGHAQMLGATAVDVYAAEGDSTEGVQAQADLLRENDGVFQINHPAEGHTGQTKKDGSPALDWDYGYRVQPDTVEVWNISRLWQPPMPSASSNDDAVRYWEGWLDRGAKVGATSGSDNHYKATLPVQGPGQPTTWVFARDRSLDAVLDGLRAGRTFISHQPPHHGGPRLYLEADADRDGSFEAMVGDTVPPGSDLRVRVENAPGATLHVFADGGREARDPSTVTSSDWTSEVFTLPDATWVRAEIDAPDGQDERQATCDGGFGDDTTYCRNQLGVIAMTSAIYQRQPAKLTLDAPTEGRHTDTVDATATLTFQGQPLAGEGVTFALGSTSVDATTDADGVAAATLPLTDPPGAYELAARFRGNDRAAGDTASQAFTILHEVTDLAYTGETEARGEDVRLSARLTEDDGPAVAGREVAFEIRGDRWTAVTNARGVAEATAHVPDHGRSVEVTVTFAGDDRFGPSADTATVRWGGGASGSDGGGPPGTRSAGSAILAAATAPRGGVGLLALLLLLASAAALRRTRRELQA